MPSRGLKESSQYTWHYKILLLLKTKIKSVNNILVIGTVEW